VTVTVIEVLPNGNLIVSGEKQIALDKGTEYIRCRAWSSPTRSRPQHRVVSQGGGCAARISYQCQV